MKKAVFGIVKTENQAINIANQLQAAGFSPNDISVLFPDRTGTRDFAHEQHTKAPEGAAAGAGTGAVLGGALGWMVGIGSLAIPGLGPFIAAGPIMAALAGAGAGAAAGGLAGALIGMGIPELEAKQYEGKIKNGNIAVRPRGGRKRGHPGKGNPEERRCGGYFLYRRSFGSQQRSRLTKEATGGDGVSRLPEPITTRAHCVRPHFGPGNHARSGIPQHIVALHFRFRLAGGGGHLVEKYLWLYFA